MFKLKYIKMKEGGYLKSATKKRGEYIQILSFKLIKMLFCEAGRRGGNKSCRARRMQMCCHVHETAHFKVWCGLTSR